MKKAEITIINSIIETLIVSLMEFNTQEQKETLVKIAVKELANLTSIESKKNMFSNPKTIIEEMTCNECFKLTLPRPKVERIDNQEFSFQEFQDIGVINYDS